MKVVIIRTGDIVNVNDSYAERLIEQGKAVIYKPAPKKAAKAAATAEKGDE